MRKQIADAELRISLCLTDGNIHDFPVFLHNHTMHGKRRGTPLVFADASIVMGLEISHIIFLVNRIRF